MVEAAVLVLLWIGWVSCCGHLMRGIYCMYALSKVHLLSTCGGLVEVSWPEKCVRSHTVAELVVTKYLDELAHWIVKDSTLWTWLDE